MKTRIIKKNMIHNIPKSAMMMVVVVVISCITVALVLQMKYSSSMLRLALTRFHSHAIQIPQFQPQPQPQESERPRATYMKSTTTNQKRRDPPPNSLPPHHSAKQITCDRSHYFYDICSIHVPTVLDPTTSTFFIPPSIQHANPTVTKIRPHPRKWENFTMSRIKELKVVKSSGPIPRCHVTHKSHAVVFSAGGYTGNFFHEFSDGFIPLFITVNSISQHQNDVVLVISKARDWWIKKYADLLGEFSKHRIIDMDNDNSIHCFPSATLGLISHGFMAINEYQMPNSKSLIHFHKFLSKAYNNDNNSGMKLYHPSNTLGPRVVLVNRPLGVGRTILNIEEVKLEVERVGFDIIVFEPTPKTPLSQSFGLINSSHGMIGVHGAALTHMLFLRAGAAFIQVVPIGIGWAAEACFGKAARAKGLNYMEYRIRDEESSLIDKYGKDEMVIKDPNAFIKGKPWSNAMNIYLKEQNVRLDLGRFRKYLKKAYKKAKELMDKEG